MWPPFILITSSTLLHIESMSFLHVSFTSGSRNQTWMTLSIIFIFVVQFNLRIRALIMAHKFSIGFKSGEFPGQSNNLNFSIHKNGFVTLELWQGAKSCWNTPSPSKENYSQGWCPNPRTSIMDPKKTSSDIKRDVVPHGIDVDASTVHSHLLECSSIARRPIKKQLLTPLMKKKRLSWEKKYKDWTVEQWRKVIFSDETHF